MCCVGKEVCDVRWLSEFQELYILKIVLPANVFPGSDSMVVEHGSEIQIDMGQMEYSEIWSGPHYFKQ
jgi:hypothetical protein